VKRKNSPTPVRDKPRFEAERAFQVLDEAVCTLTAQQERMVKIQGGFIELLGNVVTMIRAPINIQSDEGVSSSLAEWVVEVQYMTECQELITLRWELEQLDHLVAIVLAGRDCIVSLDVQRKPPERSPQPVLH
jgi:hypothetical protein